jgi:hypothetical protein
MPSWAIILIVLGMIAVIAFALHRRAVIRLTKPKSAPGIPLRNAVESIPVYGSIIKGGRTVLTPFHKLNNVFNAKITSGLQQIPIAGKYLAMPNQIAGKAVYKITDYFGLN